MKTLGAIIAGGASTRYGSPKLFASVGGMRIVDRVHGALAAVAPTCVAIVNDPAIAAGIDVPSRPDAVPAAGAVGGLVTALLWAQERGDDAILAAGGDMPFLAPALLRSLLEALARDDTVDAVLPESGGPRGVEPLCAAYSVRCIPAVRAALARGDRRMIGFHDDVRTTRLPLDEVRSFGDPAVLFFNVNTPDDRLHAERLSRERAEDA